MGRLVPGPRLLARTHLLHGDGHVSGGVDVVEAGQLPPDLLRVLVRHVAPQGGADEQHVLHPQHGVVQHPHVGVLRDDRLHARVDLIVAVARVRKVLVVARHVDDELPVAGAPAQEVLEGALVWRADVAQQAQHLGARVNERAELPVGQRRLVLVLQVEVAEQLDRRHTAGPGGAVVESEWMGRGAVMGGT
jgi:hypothetical protein